MPYHRAFLYRQIDFLIGSDIVMVTPLQGVPPETSLGANGHEESTLVRHEMSLP